MRRRKSRRQRLEQAIERAIELLDELDGDPDLEPSLGGSECIGSIHGMDAGITLGENANATPQYVDLSDNWSQHHWASGTRDELEYEHDGGEVQCWSNPMAENHIGKRQ